MSRLVWSNLDGTWWPGIEVANPEEQGHQPQEGHKFIAFNDGSGAFVADESLDEFDPNDVTKNLDEPAIQDNLNWVKSHWAAAVAEQQEQEAAAGGGGDDGGEKKSKKEKKDKKDKKDKKEKKEKKSKKSKRSDDDSEGSESEEDEEARAKRKAEKRERKEKKKAEKKAKKEGKEFAKVDSDDDDLAAMLGDALKKEKKSKKEKKDKKSDKFQLTTADEFGFSGDDDDDLFGTSGGAGAASGGGGVSYSGHNTLNVGRTQDWSPADVAMEAARQKNGRKVGDSILRLRQEYNTVRKEATEQGLLLRHVELDLIKHFEKKISDYSRLANILRSEINDTSAPEEARTEAKKMLKEIEAYDAVADLKNMALTMSPPEREPLKKMSRRFRYNDPMMGTTDLPTLEAEPIGDIEATLQSSSGGGALASHKGGGGVDPLLRTGLRHVGVMNNWLATRDLHAPNARDAQAVAAFGTVPRRYNAGVKKMEQRVTRKAIRLTGSNPLLSHTNTDADGLRATASITDIDFFDFAIQGLDHFVHDDSVMQSGASSALHTPLDSIASAGSDVSDIDSVGHPSGSSGSRGNSQNGVSIESEEHARLPSVSQMWAPLSEDQNIAIVATGNTQQANTSTKVPAADSDEVKPKLQSWRSKARTVVMKALTPYFKGTHGKKQVLDETTFASAGEEILARVHARILEMNKRPGTTRNQLLASDLDDTDELKIFTSAVHYIERHYVRGTAGASRHKKPANRDRNDDSTRHNSSLQHSSRPHHSGSYYTTSSRGTRDSASANYSSSYSYTNTSYSGHTPYNDV